LLCANGESATPRAARHLHRRRALFPEAPRPRWSGDAQVLRSLKAGASGYLLKSMLRKELIDTIFAFQAGRRRVPPELAAEIVNHVSQDDLTQKEVDVLRVVAGGNSNKAAASHFGISEETVKGHMKNILMKLGANDRTYAVMIAMKRGFLDG
jgi:DNA-binding NarL/FixJ family response regulator